MPGSEKFLELTSKFRTGIEAMDKEHQQLVDLINRMHEIFTNKGESSEILRVLDDLLQYGAVHFADEEAYMEKTGIPTLEEHRRIHKGLIEKAVEIRDKLVSGTAGVSMETFKFLQNWLMGHIAGTDMVQYGVRDNVESDPGIPERVRWYMDHLLLTVPREIFAMFIGVSGRVDYLKRSSKFPVPVKLGDHLDSPYLSKSNIAQCWRERRACVAEGDPDHLGFSYVSSSTPLVYEDEFLGVVTLAFPDGHYDKIESEIVHLTDQVSVLDTLAHDLAQAGTSFAQNVDQISTAVAQLRNNAKALVDINALVAEVAAQTNLLGLNAAIEAARAGDLGRGFGVVAGEIRRLSQMVKESSKQVKDRIEEITGEIEHIQFAVQDGMAAGEEQAAQLQELSATVEHVHRTAEELRKIR